MRIESNRLTFWRAYGLLLGGLSFCFLGMLPVTYFITGRLSWVMVKAVLLMQFFFFPPLSAVMASLMVWVGRKWRRHWEVTPTHVEVYRGENLFISLPWHEVPGVTFRRGIMGLKMHRLAPAAFFLTGISQSQFEQVEAMRLAGNLRDGGTVIDSRERQSTGPVCGESEKQR